MSSRIDEIRERHYAIAITDGREICFQCVDELRPGLVADWPCDTAHLLAELARVTSERDATLRRQYDELQADNGRLLGRIKSLENDLEHALASVWAFRAAIEDVWAKSAGESGEDGFIVSYVIPNGPLHRAIGLARGTDAGGTLLAEVERLTGERDALAPRRAAAEGARQPCTLALEYRDGVTCREEWDRGVCLNHRVIEGLRVHSVTADRLEIENRALRRQVRATYGIIHEGLHGGRPTDPEHQELCERPACRNARAALAGSREQATTEGRES